MLICVSITVKQLLDNISKTLGLNVVSKTEWMHYDADETPAVQHRTERSKPHIMSARNQIISICDTLIKEFTTKFEMPPKK